LAALCEQIITLPPPRRTRFQRLRDLLLTRQPDIARRLYSDAFADRLRDLLTRERFDLIQFEAIESVCYLPVARAAQPDTRIVFDTFNAEYLLQRVIYTIDRAELKRLPLAVYSWIQARRIERYEGAMCRQANAVIAVSPEDADALRGFRPDGYVPVVPSGIFVADYTKDTTAADLGPRALVFTGKMDYRPNVDAMLWFHEAIFPAVRREFPDARLIIVGQQPHGRLDGLRADPAVTITGWVDSVQPYLRGSAVYIAPLRMGSGTRLKLLEALATECAIVATTTAAAGLLPEVRAAMRIADDAPAFAGHIIDLLRHPEQRTALGAQSRLEVSRAYDWSAIIPRLLAVYEELGHG
jgi:glycosyltransferase involved in cell wall biosynthesis